ncbi:two-component system response regulator RR class II (RRII)-LuxR [Synechococcus sp. RS9909]|uniref:helix-turn-helix transcriptional regulator n=1 Tax=unclassified Synechococcus TaxID=2626047 RepID=UPI00006907F9|nr:MULTISPECIES: response regulator transcription factor [unclassified Synechococcus]EAQ70515.1 response regulator like protein [Synechococcus sp. RS9917]QNI80613.1 two-component system response regulator RR class II (RRII)-LuxR [Synechococcus sp. RS9909]
MGTSLRPLGDIERARRIRRLIHDQDLLVCLYPHLFAVKQMARLAGMHSPKERRFLDSRAEAIGYLESVNTPHWLLISEQLSDGSGLELLRDCKRLNSNHRCLLLLNRPRKDSLRLARQLRADACIDERSVEQRSGALIAALQALKDGHRYLDPLLGEANVMEPSDQGVVLSERQLEILALVAEGLSNREIATQLQITANTVRDHLSEIMQRLGVGNRASAVSSALRLRLIP